MKKIRVGFQLGEWTYAGTARSHFRILEALDKDRFEAFAFVWRGGQNDLLPVLNKAIGDRIVFYERSLERLGPEEKYRPVQTNFEMAAEGIRLDILHSARGGYPEWPISTGRVAPLQIETSVFGDVDPSPTLDRSIAICQYIAKRRGKTDAVIYNPIPPAKEGPNLRESLGLPKNAIVCGRIGRPANFDPIAIGAFERVQEDVPNLYYLVVAPCQQFRERAAGNANVITFPPTADDTWIESFYRTLDIFCHYRQDGEVHSTAIAQAMAYGIPVISHRSPVFNGQEETIGDGGYVLNNTEEYASWLRHLAGAKSIREVRGEAARERAMDFEQGKIVRQIESNYLEWLR